MLSDKALIKKCRKGNPDAQKQLYERFSGLVMHIAKRYSQTNEEAEDIFQEAFIGIYTSFSKSTKVDSLHNWVYTIAVRKAISHFRKQKARWSIDDSNSTEDPKLTQDDFNIFDKLEYNQLMDFIQKLPDGYRLIFNLYLVEGYSHKEIADLMQISESTSRSQLSRCKVLIKEHLKHLRTNHYEKTY